MNKDIRLKVDLIMAQTELIKLKADAHDMYDDVKKMVDDTLAEIKAELEGLS
jgi:hypothetical protein